MSCVLNSLEIGKVTGPKILIKHIEIMVEPGAHHIHLITVTTLQMPGLISPSVPTVSLKRLGMAPIGISGQIIPIAER